MSNSESDLPLVQKETLELPTYRSRGNLFLPAKLYTGLSVGTALIGNVQSFAGSEATSMDTLRDAGAFAVAATLTGVIGLAAATIERFRN